MRSQKQAVSKQCPSEVIHWYICLVFLLPTFLASSLSQDAKEADETNTLREGVQLPAREDRLLSGKEGQDAVGDRHIQSWDTAGVEVDAVGALA